MRGSPLKSVPKNFAGNWEKGLEKPQPPSTPAVDGGYCRVSFCMGFFLLSVGSSARKGHGFPSIKHRGHGERSAVRIIFKYVLRLGDRILWRRGKGAEPLGRVFLGAAALFCI